MLRSILCCGKIIRFNRLLGNQLLILNIVEMLSWSFKLGLSREINKVMAERKKDKKR